MVKEAGVSLRRATQDDKEALLRVHVDAIRVLAKDAYTDEQLRAWPGRLTTDSYTDVINSRLVLVAEAGTQVVGFCQFDPGTGEVEAILVDPQHAHTGIGSALLEAVEKVAEDSSLRGLHLASSVNAESFYRKHGFRVKERSVFPFATETPIECIMMTKHLG